MVDPHIPLVILEPAASHIILILGNLLALGALPRISNL